MGNEPSKISITFHKKKDESIYFHLFHEKYYYDKNEIFEPFTSNAYEIFVPIYGGTSFLIGDKIYQPKPGNVITYMPDEVHRSIVYKSHFYECFVILIQEEMLVFFPDYKEKLASFFFKRKHYSNNVMQLNDEEYCSLLKLLYKISELMETENMDKEVLSYAYVLRVMLLLNKVFQKNSAIDLGESYPMLLNDLLNYINSNFLTVNGVNELSEKFNYSRTYISRVFKQYTGQTIYSYIENCRIVNAKRLLIEGKSVTETCFESGFNDYSHFIQRFKKKVGVTPLKFKKENSVHK